ncbi:MAG: hypothetical protein ACOYYI_01895 [Chloroflexota bacterium]
MFTPQIGIVELLVAFVTVVLWLAVPVGVLYLLYAINKKLASIEEHLKRNGKQ